MYKAPKKKNTKRWYHIIGIALLCVLTVYLSYSVTVAWFLDESVTSNGKPNIMVIGTVDLDVQSNFKFYNLVLAPDTYYTTYTENGVPRSYGTYLTTSENNDTKTIYVRCKVEIVVPAPAELTLYFINQQTQQSNLTSGDGTSYQESRDHEKWFYNDKDGYYYYIGSIGTEEVEFNSGYHVNNALWNDIAYGDVSITMTFESIQRDYGAYDAIWGDDAPKVFTDFAKLDTGYPKN